MRKAILGPCSEFRISGNVQAGCYQRPMWLTWVSWVISLHRISLHLFCEKVALIGSICRLRTPVAQSTGKQASTTASAFLSMVTPRFSRCKSMRQSLCAIVSPHTSKHGLIDLSVRQRTYRQTLGKRTKAAPVSLSTSTL